MALSSLALVSLMCLGGCAGSSDKNSAANESAEVKNAKYQGREQDKQAMLESMFANFMDAIRADTPAEVLYSMLTDSSEYWLDTLENHARVYGPEELDTCQFYEAYSILLYRLYEREHLWQVPEDRMLWLYLSKAGVIHNFTKLKLGPMKVKNDRGSIGLEKSPEVPIMIF
jgi:outer membrane murein-binding lipoprotein Lpp